MEESEVLFVTEIRTGEYVFSADVEKTREYYKKVTLCACDGCRYFYDNIKGKFPKLEAFLAQFGIDVTRPDETEPVELDGEHLYTLVGYSVCGRIEKGSEREIGIDDGRAIKVFADGGFVFPNEQEGEYFSLTVCGISFPRDEKPEV